MIESVVSVRPSSKPMRNVLQDTRVRLLVKGACFAIFVLFLAECARIFLGTNFHEVLPGRCYRAGQPTPDFLESIQRTHGIRTILNLRDENNEEVWYQQEKEACAKLGLNLVNAGLASREQPPESDFHHFVRSMDACQEPILIHCANGNDRTGLASTIYLLLRTPTSLTEARRHLSLRYGHIPWTETSCLDRILDSYESWLKTQSKEHAADHFRDWAYHHFKQEPNPGQAARRAAHAPDAQLK